MVYVPYPDICNRMRERYTFFFSEQKGGCGFHAVATVSQKHCLSEAFSLSSCWKQLQFHQADLITHFAPDQLRSAAPLHSPCSAASVHFFLYKLYRGAIRVSPKMEEKDSIYYWEGGRKQPVAGFKAGPGI